MLGISLSVALCCRQRRRQQQAAAAGEPDLERPLLQQNGSPSAAGSVEPIKEAIAEDTQEQADSWWDASMQATLAAVLCLWALKLVQQGYVDGELLSIMLHTIS